MQALRLLLNEDFGGANLLRAPLAKAEAAETLVPLLGAANQPQARALLETVAFDESRPEALRKKAVIAIGQGWGGENYLLELVKDPAFPASLKPAAGSVLFSSYREKVQNEAAGYIDRPKGAEGSNLPPLRDLVATIGNPAKGPQVYQTYCQSCHVINGQGIDFGPDLSEIGDKFSKEGLYRTIIYPSEGINTNFEGYQLKLKDGSSTAGILLSENETEVTLKLVGGQVETYPKAEIESQEPMSQSMMPALAGAMSQEELVDLVAYLAGLKREVVQ
jgi:putative heme-binding domain-containing protein